MTSSSLVPFLLYSFSLCLRAACVRDSGPLARSGYVYQAGEEKGDFAKQDRGRKKG